MTPAQLSHDRVFAVVELLADGDGVVTTFAVIFGIFFVGGILGGILRRGRGRRRGLHRRGELGGSAGGSRWSAAAKREEVRPSGIV